MRVRDCGAFVLKEHTQEVRDSDVVQGVQGPVDKEKKKKKTFRMIRLLPSLHPLLTDTFGFAPRDQATSPALCCESAAALTPTHGRR